jgi:hypothetical protein
LRCHAPPRAHWLQIHSTNPLERLNAEIKRRTNVVGIFPNDAAITRLVGAMLLEHLGVRRRLQPGVAEPPFLLGACRLPMGPVDPATSVDDDADELEGADLSVQA